jgi:hypothetical protein
MVLFIWQSIVSGSTKYVTSVRPPVALQQRLATQGSQKELGLEVKIALSLPTTVCHRKSSVMIFLNVNYQLTVNGSMEGVASARHPVVVGHDSVHQSSRRNHSMEERNVLILLAKDSYDNWNAMTSLHANVPAVLRVIMSVQEETAGKCAYVTQ